jgi:electron transfer flavoprotein alpha subunit
LDAIVLIKYVADIENVPPDAWDLEIGTLRRAKLRMVANPLDDHALALALRARGHMGQVIAISMGPHRAERVCRRAVAYGADGAVLLSDRTFAGSDTLATARTLSKAILRVIDEFGLDSPLIFAGMQSPDGDTAQVPAEIAAMLDLPLVPYVTDMDVGERSITFRAMERAGYSLYEVLRLPAIVTVTGHAPELPFHTTLKRLAVASATRIATWAAADLGMGSNETGLDGSATRVVKIETVSRRGKRGVTLDLSGAESVDVELTSIVAKIVGEVGNTGTVVNEGREDEDAGTGISADDEHRVGLCLCVVESSDSSPTQAGLELLGEARRLADERNCHAGALLLGDEIPESAAAGLGAWGATTVLAVSGPARPASHHDYAELLCRTVPAKEPEFVLIPASLRGRTIASLAAARLGLGLTADCTGLANGRAPSKDPKEESGSTVLRQTRPALGGNILATIVSANGPAMATVRAGVFPIREYPANPVRVERISFETESFGDLVLLRTETASTAVKGADENADIVVAVGSGVGSRSRLDSYVRPFIQALEDRLGTSVTLACSRAAVEGDILPYPYQVGQTGKTVRPKLYVALGISGAIQHRLGMENSVLVVSVNPDPEAPIHDVSGFSIIGTIEETVPTMTRALRSSFAT